MTDCKILAHSLTSKERTKDVILTNNISFQSLILPPEILKGLSASGFEKPSPIQVKALPVGRCGFDLIVKSKAGTGKTLVFGLISLESIRLEKCNPQVLILAPTREIAVQIQEVIKSIGKYYEGLSVECFIGGLPLNMDKTKCTKSCHIAVGTPGRVKQLIDEGSLAVDAIKIFVLDEADKLTENSFQNDINEIYNSLPDHKQIIMCSATYANEMQDFLGQYMRSPVLVTVELETPLLLGLRQYVRLLKSSPNVVQQTKVKNDELLKVIASVPFIQCLVFSNYQNRAESICNFLNRSGWNSIFMSAAQSQPERLSSLSDLKDCKRRILVTTDLTARGIDAPNVDLVINYDIPANATTYLHRMGRAGRYGSTGNCINLTFINQETKLLQSILGFIGGQNLSMPILDDSFNLDLDAIPKQNYLHGLVEDSIADFNRYSNTISEIRNSLAVNITKNKKSMSQKDKERKVIKENMNANADALLAELASGSFEFSTRTTDANSILLNSDSIKPESNVTGSQKDNKLNASLLLQQLADEGEIVDRGPSNIQIASDQNKTLCRNKALFSVTKMLSNVEVSSDDSKDLSAYFSTLKSQEDSGCRVDKMVDEEILENIFSLAYKSQVSKSAEKWQTLLSEADKRKLSENFNENPVDFSEYEDASGISLADEQCYDEDYDFEVEKEIEVNYVDNSNDYSFMEWVPVEPRQNTKKPATKTKNIQDVAVKNSVLAKKKKITEDSLCYPRDAAARYHEKYTSYFEHCSSNLWQNGLTFDSVESFDQWFVTDWDRQISAVRNFVQNKIYLEEIGNYY